MNGDRFEIAELETPAHGVDVEELAQQHHAEFGGKREFDVDAIVHACHQCVRDDKRLWVNCWIAYDTRTHKPIGYIAGTLRPSFYSFRRYACQEMWFVLPHYRGTLVGVFLLNAFEQWANRHQAERIYTCVEHDDDMKMVHRTIALMNKLGYKTLGYMAVKTTGIKRTDDDDRSARSEVGVGQTAPQ